MDYWQECISEALEDAGITASEEQIKTISCWVEGAHDNYGMAHGHDAIPRYCEEAEELKRVKAEIEQRDRWVLSTKPCRTCVTTGVVRDGWGRDVDCPECRGSGRV